MSTEPSDASMPDIATDVLAAYYAVSYGIPVARSIIDAHLRPDLHAFADSHTISYGSAFCLLPRFHGADKRD